MRHPLGMIDQDTPISLEEAILDKVRRLPLAKQQQVLRFAEELQSTAAATGVPYYDPP